MTKEQAKVKIEQFLRLQEIYKKNESEKMLEEAYNKVKNENKDVK